MFMIQKIANVESEHRTRFQRVGQPPGAACDGKPTTPQVVNIGPYHEHARHAVIERIQPERD